MRTTTDPNNWGFTFSISDLAKLLGKSPVTIRGWERKGNISIHRDQSGDRKLNTKGVRTVASYAYAHNRITEHRYKLIEATMTMIEIIERENSR